MIFDSNKLRKDLITKRVIEKNISMEVASKEIGISKATLSRVENKKIPDIETFCKIMEWLNSQPNEYFYTLPGGCL